MTTFGHYIRLMKVRIAGLLLLVAVAGFVVTSGAAIQWPNLGALVLAGFLACTGSSVVNSYLDRDIDPLMERTRRRAATMEAISPPEKALAFGLALIGAGIALAWFLNNPPTALFIGLGSLVYLGVYTMGLKRRSESNIVIGGLAGSCPALAGSAAVAGTISLGAALLALIVFLWTPGHFWALAYRYREDYRRAGLPMLSATRDDPIAVKAITGSSILVAGFAVAFALTPAFGAAYLAVALAAAIGLGYATWRFSSRPGPATAWAGYKFSSMYLGFLLLGVIVDAIVHVPLSL